MIVPADDALTLHREQKVTFFCQYLAKSGGLNVTRHGEGPSQYLFTLLQRSFQLSSKSSSFAALKNRSMTFVALRPMDGVL